MRFPCLALLTCSLLAACGDDEDGGDLEPLDGSMPASDAARADDSGLDAGPEAPDANDGSRSVTLKFRAAFGQEELSCAQSYGGQGTRNSTIVPKDLRFYVQSVKLAGPAGEHTLRMDDRGAFQSPEVALVDLTETGGACEGGPSGSNSIVTGTVPTGDYQSAVITIGVPEALNHADPSAAPAPLEAPGGHWDWLLGYRFLIAEVVAEESDAGTHMPMDAGAHGGHHAADAGAADAGGHGGHAARPGLGFVHVGSTACTKEGTEYTCMRPNRIELRLNAFDPDQNEIVLDVAELFRNADLSSSVQCHGSGPSCEPMFTALGVDLGTGAPLPTQTAFRVE